MIQDGALIPVGILMAVLGFFWAPILEFLHHIYSQAFKEGLLK
ncbi:MULTISPECIES: hypothetical protein [Peribacillus]